MNRRDRWIGILGCLALLATGLPAADSFYYVSFKDLAFAKGRFPPQAGLDSILAQWQQVEFLPFMQPIAVGLDREEVYFSSAASGLSTGKDNRYLAIRSSSSRLPSGYLYVPRSGQDGMDRFEFEVRSRSAEQARTRTRFFLAKARHYQDLLQLGIPGTAWFRHQANEAKRQLAAQAGQGRERTVIPSLPDSAYSDLQESFEIFTGGRALAENLALDRQLQAAPIRKPSVPLASIQGITMAEIDWDKETAGLRPALDPLAVYIPHDQHALFFKSFGAMTSWLDDMDARGTPLVRFVAPRSIEDGTKRFYEEQLGLPGSALSRLLGPHLIRSVALTGSDANFRSGTDVAVIFEAVDVQFLQSTLQARQDKLAASTPAAMKVSGDIRGIRYSGVVSPTRHVSTYLAALPPAVVVSNSLVQLENIIRAFQKDLKSLASLHEYRYFRDRYRLDDANEAALLMLSDAAIRRWCSPRWRIADSRRTRAAAALAELQARHLPQLASEAGGKPPPALETVPGLGSLSLTPRGVCSSIYGSLEFQTPICELPLEQVTREEANGYAMWRDSYQYRWRQYFDPVAMRFTQDPDKLGIDLTVKPLITGSSYRGIMSACGTKQLVGRAGYPHREALLQFVMSLDAQSPSVGRIADFASQMGGGLGGKVLNWLGDWAAVCIDDDPYWDEVVKKVQSGQANADRAISDSVANLPLAILVHSRDALKLTLFLTSLRAFIEQTAPNMVAWNSKSHRGADNIYVEIAPRGELARAESLTSLKLYYVGTPSAWILSLNESFIQRFLDAQAATPEPVEADPAWLGKSMNLRLQGRMFDIIRRLLDERYRRDLILKSWANITILNEWRRLFGVTDAVDFHRRFWQAMPVCPGGGAYVWNDEYQTYESSVFGHPGQPKKGGELPDPFKGISALDAGLTFEGDGLRAIVNWRKRPAAGGN